MSEMNREEILRKAGELEKQAAELSDKHYVMQQELEILCAAKRLLEHKHLWSPFLSESIKNKEFLEQKIKEYTEEIDKLGRRIQMLLIRRDNLIDRLKKLR